MERGESLDPARGAAASRVILRPSALTLIFLAIVPFRTWAARPNRFNPTGQRCGAQTAAAAAKHSFAATGNFSTGKPVQTHGKSASVTCRQAEIRRLYSAGRWEDVIRLTAPRPGDSPDIDYYRGMALAKLKRWPQATDAFERGGRKAPHDKRFPEELAGVAFLEKRYGAAKRDLRHVLRLDPGDTYADSFLATIFSLEDNLPAALKYWNRDGMPRIESLRIEPRPQTNPILLTRAIAFSAGGVLEAAEYRTTESVLTSLGLFSNPRIHLNPLADGQFEANLIASGRDGLGGTKTEDLLSVLRGVPYETLYPEWFDLGHRAVNLRSILRWDPNKERIFASLAGPLGGNPRRLYRFYLDGRRENWNISNTFFAAPTPVNNLQLEKVAGGGEIESIISGRLRWRVGLDLSGRTFRNVEWNHPSAANFFRNGFALEYRSGLDALLLDIPERRMRVHAEASAQLGKLFRRNSNPFAQAEGGLRARWFPQAQGSDYEMTAQLRGGNTWGIVPFDDLFILGLERDNNLWLRAHIGTFDGRKGSAPLGRSYVLTNWDDFKSVYGNGFFSIRAGPFFDTGKISDPTRDFGSRQWLFDTGVEVKVRVLGSATVDLFFGKDLRTGRNTFYGTSAHDAP